MPPVTASTPERSWKPSSQGIPASIGFSSVLDVPPNRTSASARSGAAAVVPIALPLSSPLGLESGGYNSREVV
jgi:hypothetical protein